MMFIVTQYNIFLSQATMKIVSNFTFFNEFDLLEIRLATEYDHVDQFVIVESDHTFTGLYKGYNIPTQLDRFAQWWDKVTYVQIGKSPYLDPWETEYWSRAQFYPQWQGLTKDDVVIISDLDEIVRPEALQFIRNTDYDFYRLSMPFFCYKINNLNTVGHNPWPQVKAFRGYFLPDSNGMRLLNNGIPGGRSVELYHSGWHFSYLGGREKILEKIRSYAHTESNVPAVTDKIDVMSLINAGKCHWFPEAVFTTVKVDDYFPAHIYNNIDKFSDYIVSGAEKTVAELIPGTIPEVQDTCLFW